MHFRNGTAEVHFLMIQSPKMFERQFQDQKNPTLDLDVSALDVATKPCAWPPPSTDNGLMAGREGVIGREIFASRV